jgi:hypothetical protein
MALTSSNELRGKSKEAGIVWRCNPETVFLDALGK